VWTWRHLAADAGTSKIRGGVQGCTISLLVEVHPRRKPRALMEEEKKKKKKAVVSFLWSLMA
jgi:hypothetical protein